MQERLHTRRTSRGTEPRAIRLPIGDCPNGQPSVLSELIAHEPGRPTERPFPEAYTEVAHRPEAGYSSRQLDQGGEGRENGLDVRPRKSACRRPETAREGERGVDLRIGAGGASGRGGWPPRGETIDAMRADV